MANQRQGKIARLPVDIRDELCKRMLDGWSAPRLLPWLHGQPEVLESLELNGFGEQPITATNLSDWRKGGYKEWLDEQASVKHIRVGVDLAQRLVSAAGGDVLSEATQAVAAGKLLAKLTQPDDPENLLDLFDTAAKFRARSQAEKQLDLAERSAKFRADVETRRLLHKERELALSEEKFRKQTVEQFIKWANDEEALAIAQSRRPKTAKLAELAKRFFPARPADQEPLPVLVSALAPTKPTPSDRS